MANRGRILIADDEMTFLLSTADLLRKEGYECDSVTDAFMAAEKLKTSEYDLLVADIKMHGNAQLELIRDLPRMLEYIPVILVTGYPSLKSAIESIHLPVEAYLVKPVDFFELLAHVQSSIKRCQLFKAVRTLQKRLRDWNENLKILEAGKDTLIHDRNSASLEAFLSLTFQNIFGSFSDLTHLTRSLSMGTLEQEACHLLNCPRMATIKEAVKEGINILEKTKRAFKSKELGDLRRMMEDLLKEFG